MKIALCSDSFIPIIDGVGRVVYEYADRLAKRGNECYVVTPIQKTGYRGAYPFEILDFTAVKSPLANQYKSGIPIVDPHYLDRVSDMKFDIVHAHSPGTAGIEASRLAEKCGVPLVGTFHSKFYDDFQRYTGSELLSMVGVKYVVNFFERCAEVWTVSENAAETLRSYGYKGDIQIVRNGSNLRKPDVLYEIKARNEFLLTDEPILLYTGQIDRKKNLGRIIEAAAVLRKKGRRFQLVFAGQGADTEMLRDYAKQIGAGRIIFTGHIHDVTLLDGLYMAASMFIFPSLYDTAGLVVGEAAVMGTPSVVVRRSAPSEFVENGRSGFVVIDQANCIADAIEHYVFEMSDAERKTMQECARREVPIEWPSVMDEVEKRYKALTGLE